MAPSRTDWSSLLPAWLSARGSRGATADDVAEWTGLSRARSSALLVETARALGGSSERDFVSGKVFWRIKGPRASAEAPPDSRERPVRRQSHFEQIERDVAAVRIALYSGDFAALGRLLRGASFDVTRVQRVVPPRHRDRVVFLALRFRGDVAMERGDCAAAIPLLRRALERAPEAWARAEVLGLLGAAYRMAGPGALTESSAAYDAALVVARELPDAERRRAERLLLGEAVAPQIARGEIREATNLAMASHERVRDDAADLVQSGCRRALVAAEAGDLRTAADVLASLAGRALPRHLIGMLSRLRPCLLGPELTDDDWNSLLSRAWLDNIGYGFQLRLIGARLAAAPSRFNPERWNLEALQSLIWHAGIWHRVTTGTRPSLCDRCRHLGVPTALGHALGLAPGEPLGFWST